MKKSILPTLAGFACIIAFFLFSGLECNTEEVEDPNPHCQYFRSYKITWRPTPIDNYDQPLNTIDHSLGYTGDMYAYTYYPFGDIKKVCTGEAAFVDFQVEIKEEFQDDIVILGNIDYRGNSGYVSNWKYTTAGGVYSANSNTTLHGDSDSAEGTMKISLLLGYTGSSEFPDVVMQNAIVMIKMDWAFTEY